MGAHNTKPETVTNDNKPVTEIEREFQVIDRPIQSAAVDSHETSSNKLDIKDDKLKKIISIIFSDPLTAKQVYDYASTNLGALFLMRFPDEESQYVFLDTVNVTLRYKALPGETNLSILMSLRAVGSPGDLSVIWSTVIIPMSFYNLTTEKVASTSVFTQFMAGYSEGEFPRWTMSDSRMNPTVLSFQAMMGRQTFSLAPLQSNRSVVGTEGEMWNMEVQYVTNYTRHTLPLAHVDPPATAVVDKLSTMGGRQSNSSAESVIISSSETAAEVRETIDIRTDDEVASFGHLRTLLIEDEKLESSFSIEFSDPLTPDQVFDYASRDDSLFLMRLPDQNDQYLYLDTVKNTLRYRPFPGKTDLSILMGLRARERSSRGVFHVTWDTLVRSKSFYAQTEEVISRNSFSVKFSGSTGTDAPSWTINHGRMDQTLISFQNVMLDSRDIFSLAPYKKNRSMVATEGIMWNLEVLFVTNYTRNMIPYAEVVPAIPIDEEETEIES